MGNQYKDGIVRMEISDITKVWREYFEDNFIKEDILEVEQLEET